ncbi:MAG: DUF3325 domain-containing protein [Colwellia sp.]|nr:DUF3325 domain-containing protein [Colwellia sp.]
MFLLSCLSFSTMVLFCLAMDKHREQIIDIELPQLFVRTFRPLAWLLLVMTFYISTELYGWSIGPAFFFGALTAALLPLILLLTYKAKIVPILAIILPLAASVYFILN